MIQIDYNYSIETLLKIEYIREMKSLTNTQLNRIKIKDIVTVLKQKYDTNNIFQLYQLGHLKRTEIFHLKDATDEDLQNVEKLFIRNTLRIKYFPSQRKKEITIKGKSEIVVIDYEYGSDNN
jgi:hypothetical protein